MKKNIFIILTAVMFLAMGIGSAFAETVTTEKSEVKAAVEKTAGCCADNADCKEKCTCTDCKHDGKCDEKCECCCKDGMKGCTDKSSCKDAKAGCCDKKAEVKKADCGAAQGCGAQKKSGCGMMKR
jgi:hypothetical protein